MEKNGADLYSRERDKKKPGSVLDKRSNQWKNVISVMDATAGLPSILLRDLNTSL